MKIQDTKGLQVNNRPRQWNQYVKKQNNKLIYRTLPAAPALSACPPPRPRPPGGPAWWYAIFFHNNLFLKTPLPFYLTSLLGPHPILVYITLLGLYYSLAYITSKPTSLLSLHVKPSEKTRLMSLTCFRVILFFSWYYIIFWVSWKIKALSSIVN